MFTDQTLLITGGTGAFGNAFLNHLFSALGRKCAVQEDNVIYHVDYGERPNWNLLDGRHVQRSVEKAREMTGRFAGLQAQDDASLVAANESGKVART